MYTENEIKTNMEKAADYWTCTRPEAGNCAWERGAYFLGNMAAYEVLKKQAYLDYALQWAQQNDWRFYDDRDYHTTNADNVLCGETYLTLMEQVPNVGTDTHMLRSLENMLKDPKSDYWWWVDTIYMALPFYNRMGVRQKDGRYFEKAHALFTDTRRKRGLYDTQRSTVYRDENYLPENARTITGKKVFWSRGNGWVFAGLARTLAVLPKENPYYEEYREVFQNMAQAVARCQQKDGFWRTSLLEPNEYNMPETSGTALFVLGYALGRRLKVLDASYESMVWSGYGALVQEALEADGRLGWVQGVAGWPGVVEKGNSNDYAVGTFLLLSREIIALLKNKCIKSF